MRWAGNVARSEEKRGAYKVLVGRPDRKRPLVRPGLRWKDNIKTDFPKNRMEGMDWIDKALDKDRWRALVNAVMKIWDPKMR
jgi:hypothetical protein